LVDGERGLQPEGRHPPRGVAASGFRPLRNIPHCCLPQESGPCLSPSVAGRPLRPATRHRLGRPSPHQQADRPRAHPRPKNFPPPPMRAAVISGISPGFPELSQSLGQVTHVLLTRSPLTPKGPFDLHVLSTPPAFVLSQDQTLQKRSTKQPRRGPGRHPQPWTGPGRMPTN
jgi:hypothetical protein